MQKQSPVKQYSQTGIFPGDCWQMPSSALPRTPKYRHSSGSPCMFGMSEDDHIKGHFNDRLEH